MRDERAKIHLPCANHAQQASHAPGATKTAAFIVERRGAGFTRGSMAVSVSMDPPCVRVFSRLSIARASYRPRE
jgi:hypothetical protein